MAAPTNLGPAAAVASGESASPHPPAGALAYPLTLASTRAALGELGRRPRHRLGQNFLVDANIVRKSLELAQIAPGDAVVEVGPGLGTLTGTLLGAGASVWAVELDEVLAPRLRAVLGAAYPGRLAVLEADAVAEPRAGLPEPIAATGRWKVVANLPYSAATPWLEAVLWHPLPERLVLMVQREAAQRYCAAPATGDFGAISVLVQLAYQRRPGHPVPATCFYPAPDVESVLLHLERRPDARLLGAPWRALLRRLFTRRRKQLGGLLRGEGEVGAQVLAALQAAGVAPTARPEEVAPEIWGAVAEDGKLRVES